VLVRTRRTRRLKLIAKLFGKRMGGGCIGRV
jgi:hypothetical protein